MPGDDEKRSGSGKTVGQVISEGEESFTRAHSEGKGETTSLPDRNSHTVSISTGWVFSEEDSPGADEARDIGEAVTVSRARFAGGIVTFTIRIDFNRLQAKPAGTSWSETEGASFTGRGSFSGEEE